jgi:hydrogenase maturation protease
MPVPASLRILVCGDAERGDDGAPLVAIGRLLPTLPRSILDQIEVRRHRLLRLEDLADLPTAASCVIVDTADGVDPGVVVTVPLDALAAESDRIVPRSAHGRLVADGLRELAARRGAIPPGAFLGIGGRSFGFGVPMSIPVRNAIPVYSTAIALEIQRLLEVATIPGR